MGQADGSDAKPATKPRIRIRAGDQSGQAMILGVMATFLLAVSLFGGLYYTGAKADLQRTTQTNLGGGRVATALANYASRNGQLPCPDTAGAGSAGTCDGTATVWGLLPWKSLNLSPQDVVDPWGHRLTYAVAKNGSGAAPYVCDPSAARNSGGQRATWSQLTAQSGGTSAAYLVVSHGQNGRGAFGQNGTQVGPQIAVPSGATEAYNCPANVTGAVCPTAGLSCPSGSHTCYLAGPYVANSFTSANTSWFDDTVTPSTGQQFACLCVEPTISGVLDTATGYVKATASLTAPTTCNASWATSLQAGAITTSAGKSGSASTVLTSTTTVTASNLLNGSWTSGQPQQPSETFTVSAGPTQYSTGSGPATQVPAMSGLGITTNADQSINTYYASAADAASNTPTTVASGTQTLTYSDGTYLVTFTGSGALCYDSTRNALGIVHSTNCWLQSGDTLSITVPSNHFVTFSMLLYLYATGSITVAEANAGAAVCTPSDVDDTVVTHTTTHTACSVNPVSNANPIPFSSVAAGYLDMPRESVTQTVTVTDDNNGNALLSGPINTTPLYNTLTISTDATAEVGLVQFIASP